MKNTKKSLFVSVLSLLLCLAMLLGTTYAWFTDSVTSGKNTIVAGNLDVELYHSATGTPVTTNADNKVKDATNLFPIAKWEPGVICYENFAVVNEGDLALKYAMSLNIFDKNSLTTDSVKHDLSEVIKVAVVDGNFTGDRTTAQGLTFQTLADFQKQGKLAVGASNNYGIVLYWQPTDNDNLYNVNNGKTVDAFHDGKNELFIEFGVNLVATQDTVEVDSFDKYYDKNASFPNIPAIGTNATKTETVTEEARTNGMVVKNDLAKVEIPAGNIDDDASKYRLDVERIKNITSGDNVITLTSPVDTLVTYEVKLIKIDSSNNETNAQSNGTEYTVTLFVGTHCDLVKLYHKGNEIENFTYNPGTGEVVYRTNSFSPYAAEVKFAGGIGTKEYPYLIENEVQFMGLDEEFKAWADAGKTDIYFDLIDDMDMAAESIQSEKGTTWSRARWFEDLSTYPNTKIYLNLNDHSINNLDCFLFAEVHNMEMKNGTVNFVNGNNSLDYVPGIIYYCDPNVNMTLSFNNLTLNGDYEVNMQHYGPILAQCYDNQQVAAETVAANSVTCGNVVSNVKIWNVNGDAYTGGILGYVGFSTVTMNNSKFNGYIQSARAGGFMNPMKATLTLKGSGNILNGSILATSAAQEFGAGDTKNMCTKTENAHLDKVTVSTGLLGTMNMGDEIKINHTDESIKRYAVSILVWTNQATCTTVFNVNVPAESVGTLNTGLYKNYFENTRTDGSAPETKQNSGWYDGCIWLDGNTYKVYCSDTTEIATNHNATIYVYGYKEDGTLVTYQSQSYSPAKQPVQ